MLFDFGILALRLVERVIKQNFTLRRHLLDSSGLVVRDKLVMNQLEYTDLANLAVD